MRPGQKRSSRRLVAGVTLETIKAGQRIKKEFSKEAVSKEAQPRPGLIIMALCLISLSSGSICL